MERERADRESVMHRTVRCEPGRALKLTGIGGTPAMSAATLLGMIR